MVVKFPHVSKKKNKAASSLGFRNFVRPGCHFSRISAKDVREGHPRRTSSKCPRRTSAKDILKMSAKDIREGHPRRTSAKDAREGHPRRTSRFHQRRTSAKDILKIREGHPHIRRRTSASSSSTKDIRIFNEGHHDPHYETKKKTRPKGNQKTNDGLLVPFGAGFFFGLRAIFKVSALAWGFSGDFDYPFAKLLWVLKTFAQMLCGF